MDSEIADAEEVEFVDPLIGTMIGRYQVEKKIGQGGMGAVYSLWQPAIHKRMALKLLHEQYAEREDIVQRFFGEAKAVNLIGHPNIVDITDFSHLPDGRPFIIMEFLEGESLEDYLEHQGPLPADEAVALLKPICSALEAAHRKGIVHRDLKPENLFLCKRPDEEVQVKVLDFGIAKLKDTGTESGVETQAGVVLGTPTYMSPEQAEGKTKEADHRTDIYSLGVLLYEMLIGHPPFRGETFAKLIMQHLHDAPPALHETRDDLPAAWSELLSKALAKAPKDRFQSMSGFYAACEAASSDESRSDVAKEAPLASDSERDEVTTRDEFAVADEVPEFHNPRHPAIYALPLLLVLVVLAFVVFKKDPEPRVPSGPALTTNAHPLAPRQAPAELAANPQPAALPADAGSPARTRFEADAAPQKSSPEAKPKGLGTLRISANPWAQVYLDGKHIGQTPLQKTIEAGRHKVRLKNETSGASKDHRFHLGKGQTHTIQEGW